VFFSGFFGASGFGCRCGFGSSIFGFTSSIFAAAAGFAAAGCITGAAGIFANWMLTMVGFCGGDACSAA